MAAVNWTQSTTFYTNKSSIIASNVTGNGWLEFLDALGWMENDSSYTTNAGATYVGIYQVGNGVLTDTHFLTHIGNSLLGIATRQGVGEDPIGQELAGLMEFTGVPDIGGAFVSKYSAVRIIANETVRDNWNLLLGSTFTINYTNAVGVAVMGSRLAFCLKAVLRVFKRSALYRKIISPDENLKYWNSISSRAVEL